VEFINSLKLYIMQTNKKTIKKILTGLFLLLVVFQVKAQDFVYTPKNPAFGGNTFNYQWLLSSAQAQDTYKSPDQKTTSSYSYGLDPVKDFAESLNRQILSNLSREIVKRQFGEDALQAGTYIVGDYQIEIGDATNGLNITIVDNASGATTTVSVPYF
jgi:curli production assembly/transport component CsgF